MTMKAKILLAALLGLIMLFMACEDEEQNNNAQISLEFEALQVKDMLKSTDTIVFDSAMVGISEIEIEQEAEEDDDNGDVGGDDEMEYEFEGSYQVNLMSGTKLSEVVEIEPGVYTEMEAEIEPVLDDGHSIYIEALYTNSKGDNFTVIYYTSESLEFEVENEQGIEISNQEVKDLIVRIDLESFFSSIDLDAANVGESGTILINETHNEAMADQLENDLDDHSEFEEDDDDDS
jgi:hypothetical protein